jgi:hypothetical protein
MFTKEKENSLLAVAAIIAAALIGNAVFGEKFKSVRDIPLSSLCAELARRI